METVYPPGPASVPANLTQPTAAYRRHAWLALAGLALFVVLYFLLAGWFTWTAYHLLAGALHGGRGSGWGVIVGLCAAFLAIFMLKALVFVKHGGETDDIEITVREQPQLFAFLQRLADEAGAPRAHRVFLAANVNAAVFYDLSILNLIYPSKKNLVIGLGLVNVLNLGELKAVLAHEFGHFAQRSMALGRWVYIAQQIAAHIVAKRDLLDRFLNGLSRFDVRIAWIGWLLSLIVWSIRSLVETFFQAVVLAQRALSREMEMQADLVAVSLTGSDALVHALHRLQAADEAWERAVAFGRGELAGQRATQDLFAVQSRIIEHIGAIRADPTYGKVPVLPGQPAQHRLFQAQFAQPPRMWSTHPFNHEREDNAKRVYVAAPIDERSAWALFDDAQRLKQQLSAQVLGKTDAPPLPTEDALRELDRQFEREAYKREYRGAYLGRSFVRGLQAPAQLYDPAHTATTAELDALYPESLAADLEQLRNLEQDKAMLEALRDGVYTAPNGVIRHRGKALEARALPHEIDALRAEIAAVEAKISEHDRRCRSVHRAVAASLGNGWEAHLLGTAHVLHYAEHSAANLSDARGFLANTVAVVTAARRVNDKGVQRVLGAANEAYAALANVYRQADEVKLNADLAQRMGLSGDWKASLGEFTLPAPVKDNLNDWLKVIDGWIDSALAGLDSLRRNALEQLLSSEAQVARARRDGAALPGAPAPAQAPAQYATLLPGQERRRQTKLDWWARFQNADGIGAGIARLAVALGIVGAGLSLGGGVGDASVHVYNGLARALVVDFGGKQLRVAPSGTAAFNVKPQQHYAVQTKTSDGQLIESFDAQAQDSFARYVYNVAGASPIVEWTAVYGNTKPRPERLLGAQRWHTTAAEVLFQEPPTSVRTKGGGASKDVLSGFGDRAPGQQLNLVQDQAQQANLINAHARWDAGDSSHIMYWLGLASRSSDFGAILSGRLRDNPTDIVALRYEQEHASASNAAAGAHQQVCQRQQGLAEATPTNGDLRYLAIRCIADKAERDQAFVEAQAKWPQSGWLAYAAGYTLAEQERWREALASLETARHSQSAVANMVLVDIARVRRMLSPGAPEAVNLADLAPASEQLRFLLAAEAAQVPQDDPMRAYAELAHGQIEQALQIAKDGDDAARVLRLAAASDGANATLAQQALALPHDRGMDASSLWASIGLALRTKADVSSYVALLDQYMRPEDAKALSAFVEILRSGGSAQTATQALGALHPAERGYALSAGVIALGKSAPQAWRETAKRLLFAWERPYFT